MKSQIKGTEVQVTVNKERSAKAQGYDTLVSCILRDPATGERDHFMGVACLSPQDQYDQVKGKRVAFTRLLESMREHGEPKALRAHVWRMGEVYMGLRGRDFLQK